MRTSPLRHWSGWLPIAIPLFMLALAARYVLIHGGFVREPDEGVEAHLFQLLMPIQLLVTFYFAISWLPRAPRPASVVLALQIGLALVLLAAVYLIDHAVGLGASLLLPAAAQ